MDQYDLVYVGTLRKQRNITFLLEVFRRVKKRNKDLTMVIVGGDETGGDLVPIKHYLSKYNLSSSVKITGFVENLKALEYIKNSKIGISPIPPIRKYIVSSPSKTIEYMQMGIPIVANKEILDQDSVIRKSQCGFSVKYNINSFVKAVSFLLDNEKVSLEKGAKGKKWVYKYRNYSDMAKNLEIKYNENL